MIYAPGDRLEANALAAAVRRGRVRLMVPGVYTDDFATPAAEWVGGHLLAVLAVLYPDWHVSHSTAALGQAVNGKAYISGSASNVRARRLPGVEVKRVRQLRYPETVTVPTGEVARRRLNGAEEPILVRMSAPLQTILEVLRRDRRDPSRGLSDRQVRGLIEQLPRAERMRAAPFAERNGLSASYARFRELEASLAKAAIPAPAGQVDLDVFFYHYRVGRLSEFPAGGIRFEYDAAWPIALSGLPPEGEGPSYEGAVLPPFFDNLLPEGWAEARLRAVYKIASDDAYALLRTTPKYLSNVTLRPAGLRDADITLDEISTALTDAIPGREGRTLVAEAIGQDPDTRELWLEMARRGATALSGVQPKLPVHLLEPTGVPRLELGHLGNTSSHILKLPSRDFADLIENEWAALELARGCGLEVADVRQVRFQEGSALREPGLLIERFDLARDLRTVATLPLLEDAASLLGLPRKDKYRTSLERVADALVAAGLDRRGREAFVKHVVFSWLIGNGDLHAKNVAVLHLIEPGQFGASPARTGVAYTPLYDLVNTRLLVAGDYFALPVNGKQNNLRRNEFRVLGRRLGIERARVDGLIEELTTGLAAHLEPVLEVSGLAGERRERYAEIVRENAARL